MHRSMGHQKMRAAAGTATLGPPKTGASLGTDSEGQNRSMRRPSEARQEPLRDRNQAASSDPRPRRALMARPSSKPRVPEMDPSAEALSFTGAIFEHYREGIVQHLAPACSLQVPNKKKPEDFLRDTHLYALTLRLAEYAIRGSRLAEPLSDLLARLEALAASPLWGRADVASIAANVDPNSEESAIKLLIAAALARQQLERGKEPVTSAQLAVLAGMSRRHVGQLIRDGELAIVQEGRTGTGGGALVKASVARNWLAARGVPGFERTLKS
ncbi:MAG: hypothetical protein JWN04_3427 [Myxococcaceae bacterium]|nr:hypothetical protein [Myxococcaceae bacterium]